MNYEDKLTLEAWNGKLGKLELLHSETLESSVFTHTIDMSYIDWNDWEYVFVFIAGRPSNSNATFTCLPRKAGNGTIETYCATAKYLVSGTYSGPVALLFLPRHNAENPIRCLTFGSGGGAAWGASAIGLIDNLYCSSGGSGTNLSQDAEITVWGIR